MKKLLVIFAVIASMLFVSCQEVELPEKDQNTYRFSRVLQHITEDGYDYYFVVDIYDSPTCPTHQLYHMQLEGVSDNSIYFNADILEGRYVTMLSFRVDHKTDNQQFIRTSFYMAKGDNMLFSSGCDEDGLVYMQEITE